MGQVTLGWAEIFVRINGPSTRSAPQAFGVVNWNAFLTLIDRVRWLTDFPVRE